jgi:putative ABC transport system permease protein
MRWWNELKYLVRKLNRGRAERELEEEIGTHLEMETQEKINDGLSLEEALYAARRAFGSVALATEDSRAWWGFGMLEEVCQDLHYGARMLVKQPGFTFIAILTLALGIGANTAIFSVVNAVLLRPLPFQEPERVVMVWNKGAAAAGGDRTPLAVADLFDWRAQSHAFDGIAAFQYDSFTLTGVETPESVPGARVTANFFAVLGVPPALGRTFLPDEDRQGAARVVLLSDGFWRSRFGADPQAVGRTINFNGNSYTVIGVMPPALNFPFREAAMWATRQMRAPARRGPYFFTGVARLKPGVTLQQAAADTRAMKSSFGGEAINFNLLPVNDFVVGDVRPALVALLVAVTLVLLIAAVNVANLTLVRAAARVNEISIRTALGARRGRIIRQLLAESLLMAVIGGALGGLGAYVGIDLLVKLAPADIPRLEQIGIDGRVLGWTALLTLLTGVVCGLTPAWQSAHVNLNNTLKEGGRGATEGAGQRRWRSLLVVTELTLAVLLLVGSGLLLKSLLRLQQVDLGINTDQVLTAYVELPGQRYSQSQHFLNFYDQVLENARALPGVRAAALSNSLPPDLTEYSDDFTIEGRPVGVQQIPPIAYMVHVSPDYFHTLGIALRRGRAFTTADTANTGLVALLSETAARQFFPNEDPLGKRINMNDQGPPNWVQIVGVVSDVKYTGLTSEAQPAIYQPLAQAQSSGIALILKTETADPASLTAAMREMLKSMDNDLQLIQKFSIEQRLALATAQPRFRTTLIALFAALALILACVGIYGVISYSVAQRTHEIGIRVAFGAQARDVLKLVLQQGLKLTLVGVGCGLLAALALTRFMQNLLFGVSATDPLTFTVIALLLITVALLACWIPARRATKVDPLMAIRHE